jgi:hypothetical protein
MQELDSFEQNVMIAFKEKKLLEYLVFGFPKLKSINNICGDLSILIRKCLLTYLNYDLLNYIFLYLLSVQIDVINVSKRLAVCHK